MQPGDGEVDFGNLLQQCRQNFGSPPRGICLRHLVYLHARPPRWCQKDPLRLIYKHQWRLFKHGRVVWCHVVQANELLFAPGATDCPASVIYGQAPEWDREVPCGNRMAQAIFQLKNTVPEDPVLAKFAAGITNEMSRTMGEPVPAKLCGAAPPGIPANDLTHATIMVIRKHLPCGFLTATSLPLLINPDQTPVAMVLPARYWPTDLIDLE